jgi:hypothetical protein
MNWIKRIFGEKKSPAADGVSEDERRDKEDEQRDIERQASVIDAIKNDQSIGAYAAMDAWAVKKAYHRYRCELEARVKALERAGWPFEKSEKQPVETAAERVERSEREHAENRRLWRERFEGMVSLRVSPDRGGYFRYMDLRYALMDLHERNQELEARVVALEASAIGSPR